MDKLRKKRITIRVSVMVVAALLLALLPQLLIKTSVLVAFYLDDASQRVAQAYQRSLYWVHLADIMILLAANLIFFIVNEKKGDTGLKLHGRLLLQRWINFLLIWVGIGALASARYGIVSENLIGNYGPGNFWIIFRVGLPYLVLAMCGAIIWILCMHYVPATNVPLRSRIMAKWDDKLQTIKY